MIINEKRQVSGDSLKVGNLFTEDDQNFYEVLSMSSGKEGSTIVKARDLKSLRDYRTSFDTGEKTTVFDFSEIPSEKVNDKLKVGNPEHFKEETGVNLQKSGINHIAVGISESKLKNKIKEYNRKFKTHVSSGGIDNKGALIVLF